MRKIRARPPSPTEQRSCDLIRLRTSCQPLKAELIINDQYNESQDFVHGIFPATKAPPLSPGARWGERGLCARPPCQAGRPLRGRPGLSSPGDEMSHPVGGSSGFRPGSSRPAGERSRHRHLEPDRHVSGVVRVRAPSTAADLPYDLQATAAQRFDVGVLEVRADVRCSSPASCKPTTTPPRLSMPTGHLSILKRPNGS